MIANKDLEIISHLRRNARQKLTLLSRKTKIPVSTIYDKIKSHEEGLIVGHTSLINFAVLGFATRANITIKVPREVRDEVKTYLSKHQNINSLFKINNGFDFLMEGIFRHIKDLEDFLEALEAKFKVQDKRVYYIIEDLKREAFLSQPDLLKIV